MSERFNLFRLSLLPNKQTDLFYDGIADYDMSRNEYIRTAFSARVQYGDRGFSYSYEPDEELSKESINYVFARLGRPYQQKENQPPEGGLKDRIHEGWKASLVIIDPSEYFDGQKVAIELDRSVGNPLRLARDLVQYINSRNPAAPYIIFIEPISQEDSFWDFVKKEKMGISAIQFDFVSPNMVDVASQLQNELDDYKKEQGAEQVSIRLSTKTGSLKVFSEKVRAAVARAARGKGRTRARALSGRTFDSERKIASGSLPAPTATDSKVDPKISIGRRALFSINLVFDRTSTKDEIGD